MANWFLVALLMIALAGTACRTRTRTVVVNPNQPLPGWVSQPKMSDSVNLYLVGESSGQASMQTARATATEDAQRQLSQLIAREAGLGPESLDFNGQLPLPTVQMVPGCFHHQYLNGTYAGWVQVSFPIKDKRELVERLRGR